LKIYTKYCAIMGSFKYKNAIFLKSRTSHGARVGNRRIDITPDRSLIKKLGRIGYRTEQAIAELVDNSIDARVAGTREEVGVELDFGRRRIIVRDDGAGMGLDALRRAWVLGSSPHAASGRLGMFGIGMKSACSALGRSFSTRTTVMGSTVELTAAYDENRWLGGKGGWPGLDVEESSAEASAHGTTVSVSDLSVALYRGQASHIRASFGRRYAHYIFDGQVRITVNGRLCVPIEPDIDVGSKVPLDIDLPGGNRAHGWAAILRGRPTGADSGFGLYRNGRLVTSHARLGAGAMAHMPWVVGELHLDHVPVNVLKTGFLTDSAAYRDAMGAVLASPAIRELATMSARRKGGEPDHALALDGGGAAARLPRLGDAASRRLLHALSDSGPIGSGRMPVVLEDADSGVYRVVGSGANAVIAVNRNSGLFRAFRNPVYLLGMLRIEARALSGHPDAQRLLSDRNREWEGFVSERSRAGAAHGRARSRDTLPESLAELRDMITSRSSARFQFTALSILWPFLNNLYRVMTHTVYTARGAGHELKGIISGYDGYRTLLDPNSAQVRVTHDAMDGGSLVVIRERHDVPKSTAATYSKAWVDLYAEAKRGCSGVYERELEMFWDLEAYSLMSKDEVLRFAKRRKLGAEIREYLGGGR